MTWKSVFLTSEQVVCGELFKIQDDFEQVFMTMLAPKGAAMFGDSLGENEEGNVELHVYFSPDACKKFDVVLSQYAPEPCERPAKDSVSLLVGYNKAWDMLE